MFHPSYPLSENFQIHYIKYKNEASPNWIKFDKDGGKLSKFRGKIDA